MDRCSPLSFSDSTRRLNIDAFPSHLFPPFGVNKEECVFDAPNLSRSGELNGFTENAIPTPLGAIKPH